MYICQLFSFIVFVVTLVIVSMCRFVIEVSKKSYQITIVSPGGEKMTEEKRQKLFLHNSFSIQYIENCMIQFKEGTHKKLLNRKNVAFIRGIKNIGLSLCVYQSEMFAIVFIVQCLLYNISV